MSYSEDIAIKMIKQNGAIRMYEQAELSRYRFKNERLIYHITEGFKLKWLMEKKGQNIKEITKNLNLDLTTVRRQLNMTLLAPDIIEAILEGKQPLELSIKDFKSTKIPRSWKDQRIKYGFKEK
jgi:hypothetical protein